MILEEIEKIRKELYKNYSNHILTLENVHLLMVPHTETTGYGLSITFKTVGFGPNAPAGPINKKRKLLSTAEFFELNLADSFGYGDSKEDFEFLRILRFPFIVLKNGTIQLFEEGNI